MNLDTKMVLVGDEEQPIQHTWRSRTNSASGSVYLEDSMTTMMDLTKCNMVGQPYPTSSHLAWVIEKIW